MKENKSIMELLILQNEYSLQSQSKNVIFRVDFINYLIDDFGRFLSLIILSIRQLQRLSIIYYQFKTSQKVQYQLSRSSSGKMKAEEDYESDIRFNKVKEGFLIKRSRILKEWKERWMVLTKTHLYSFVEKQIYKKPTEKIPLKEVSTIKSYYKNQYHRPEVIRIESDDADFYLSAKNHQEKWAWMTAIEKMTNALVCGHGDTVDSQVLIRETIRMTTAIRKTANLKSDKKDGMNNDIPKDLFKRLNFKLQSEVINEKIIPVQNKQKPSTINEQHTTNKNNNHLEITKPDQQALGKVIQKVTEVPQVQQKIVYVPEIKQKIVYVPEVKEKVIYVPQVHEKIVYVPEIKEVTKTVDAKSPSPENREIIKKQSNGSWVRVLQFFEEVMQLKCENPKPLIEFIVFLIFSDAQRYTQVVLQFATSDRIQHAFSNAFLQVINQQIDESKLNSYLQFIIVLYQNNNEYFYLNDLKLLIEILIRQMEMNRSYFNQYLIISVVAAIAKKEWWPQVQHRRQELLNVVNDVKSWTTDTQTKLAAEELLQKL